MRKASSATTIYCRVDAQSCQNRSTRTGNVVEGPATILPRNGAGVSTRVAPIRHPGLPGVGWTARHRPAFVFVADQGGPSAAHSDVRRTRGTAWGAYP
jgi:hypothetical protein